MKKVFLLITCLALILVIQAQTFPGLRVQGRFVYDKCGEKVILKGANSLLVFTDRYGIKTYPELAKTGANACRIGWQTGHAPEPVIPAAHLDSTLKNCIRNKMIPIIGLWDATGKVLGGPEFQAAMTYWMRTDILAVLKKHEQYLIINIANEAGPGGTSDQLFKSTYEAAVNLFRQNGVHSLLMIDASNWGRNESYILNNGQYLLDQDPDHNLIFSWHPWDNSGTTSTAQLNSRNRIKAALDQSIQKNLPFIIGEFSHLDVSYNCCIEWRYMMQYSYANDIGWFPWSWCCGSLGMTTNSNFGSWNGTWGDSVSVQSPYSIQKTAVRPASIATGTCTCTARPQIAANGNALSSTGITNPISYQWYRNGIAIMGATASTYTATQQGNYTVSVANSTCLGVSQPYNYTGTNIFYNSEEEKIKIYPQVASDFIYIETSWDKVYVLELFDYLGKMIFSKSISERRSKIDLPNIANGVYVIRVSDKDHNNTEVHKLIIHK